MLLIQLARLIWALVTPVGPFGDWRAREPVVVSADARMALFAGLDPFFRSGAGLAGDGSLQQVTSLPLKLYGISLNEASGDGSAIIAYEGADQASYAVGEEIAPGVVLKEVHFDHVVIERGGASEMLYIDQSGSGDEGEVVAQPFPAQPGGESAPGAAGSPAPSAATSPATALRAIGMMPRNEKGVVTGIILNARQGDEAMSRAGFQPGDIIVQVNGRPVSSANDIVQLQDALRPGARLSLMVERGAATVPISLILPENP